MTYSRYEPIIYEARPAVYLWPIWHDRYARIRFTDTNERRTVNVMDITRPDEISEVAAEIIAVVKDAFKRIDEAIEEQERAA